MPTVKSELLEILCCPVSGQPLLLDGNWLISTDKETRRRYPIRNGIPVLMENEGEQLAKEAWQKIMGDISE